MTSSYGTNNIIDLPFILGIQTPWHKKMMLIYGYNGAIAMVQHLKPMCQSIYYFHCWCLMIRGMVFQ